MRGSEAGGPGEGAKSEAVIERIKVVVVPDPGKIGSWLLDVTAS